MADHIKSADEGETAEGSGRSIVSSADEDLSIFKTNEQTLVGRDRLAQEFIDQAATYHKLKATFDTSSKTEQHQPGPDLFYWGIHFPNAVAHRLKLMRKFFSYERDFFKFASRPNANKQKRPKQKVSTSSPAQANAKGEKRSKELKPPYFYVLWQRWVLWAGSNRNTVVSLLLRPSTHADAAEEDLEWKLPDDKRIRALVRALTLIVEYNQVQHIQAKRKLQLWYSIQYTVFAVAYLLAGPPIISAIQQIEGTFARLVWAGSFVALSVVVAAVLVERYILELKLTTLDFHKANEDSCQGVSLKLQGIISRIRNRVVELLRVIEQTIAKEEFLLENSWPRRAKGLFKLTMWEGKRAEAIEEFRQLQLERLRKFYLVSDWLGNLSSILLCVILSAIIILVTGLLYYLGVSPIWEGAAVALLSIGVVALFSWISTRPTRSFNIEDLKDYTSPERWSESVAHGGGSERSARRFGEKTDSHEDDDEHVSYYKKLSDAYKVALERVASERQSQKTNAQLKESPDQDITDED